MTKVRAGSQVYIEVKVEDLSVSPPVPFDPEQGVQITLTNPAGTVIVSVAAMTQVSTGVYKYLFQTQTSYVKGVWTYEFRAEHQTTIHLSTIMGAFELV